MKYRIITTVDGQMLQQNPTDLHAWADACGIEVTGTHDNPQTRDCMQGQPELSGFAGPMYDGTDEHGEPVMRYEDWAAYRRLSA